jgi:hypothetical protein
VPPVGGYAIGAVHPGRFELPGEDDIDQDPAATGMDAEKRTSVHQVQRRRVLLKLTFAECGDAVHECIVNRAGPLNRCQVQGPGTMCCRRAAVRYLPVVKVQVVLASGLPPASRIAAAPPVSAAVYRVLAARVAEGLSVATRVVAL